MECRKDRPRGNSASCNGAKKGAEVQRKDEVVCGRRRQEWGYEGVHRAEERTGKERGAQGRDFLPGVRVIDTSDTAGKSILIS